MDELFAHPKVILEVLIAYWAFSAIVSGMPDPPEGSFYYKWAYATLHAFAGNLTKFAESKIQSLETNVRQKSPDGTVTDTQIKVKETAPAPKDGQ